MTKTTRSLFPHLDVGGKQQDVGHDRDHFTRSLNIGCWTQHQDVEPAKLFGVLHAAWAVVLRAYTARDDICFGVRSPAQAHPSPPVAMVYKADVTGQTPIRQLLEQHCQSGNCQPSESVYKTAMVLDDARDPGAVSNLDATTQYDLIIRLSTDKSQATFLERVEYSKPVMTLEYSHVLLDTFERAVSQVIAHLDATVGDLDLCSDVDIRRLHLWNENVGMQVPRQELVHELITKRCGELPESVAITAWDGDMAYSELDRRSSALADHLVELGVSVEQFVPVYFEKSKWVVVAALAVLKAGGAFVLIDASLPLDRLRRICQVTDSRVVLCSQLLSEETQKLSLPFVMVGDAHGEPGFNPYPGYKAQSSRTEHNPNPHNALYAIFTSGSTGEPKGIVITHAALCSTTDAADRGLRYSRHTRALQFASHSFTVSPREILGVLLAGGCLCIPSEKDRVDDIAGFINRKRVTVATLTPSVANVLSPSETPSLVALIMGGESVSSPTIESWACSNTLLVAVYSASELAATATVAYDITPDRDQRNKGYACGAKLWVISPDNPDNLAPVGAVGELVMESHSLAREYLGDAQRSAQHFRAQAPWQQRFPDASQPTPEAKPARLYHTGDLCRYNLDGSLHLVGRKDHQVKINGQRVELGEVEYHLQTACQAISDAVIIKNLVVLSVTDSHRRTKLVALLNRGNLPGDQERTVVTPLNECIEWIRALTAHLAASVPRYMIPAHIMFANNVPMTRTGKLDRVLIQDLVVKEFLPRRETETVSLGTEEKQGPLTDQERILQAEWVQILGIPESELLRTDDFFRRGGDSITAMQLVSSLRQSGFTLTVAQIFTHPILSDMAAILRRLPPSESAASISSASDVAPFTLLGNGSQEILNAVERKLGDEAARIEDVYPCTVMQETMITLTAEHPALYISTRSWTLGQEVDLERFCDAWERTFLANSILQTRIVQLSQGMFQVVLKEKINWEAGTEASLFSGPINIAQGRLIRFAIAGRIFAVQLHHALFDAWSLNLICEQVQRAYHGDNLIPRPFAPWIKHLLTQDHGDADNFWRSEFAGLNTVHFPCSAVQRPTTVPPESKLVVSHTINTVATHKSSAPYTVATILRLAWAIVLWRQTGSEDVVFGATAMGRTAAWEAVRQLTGPIITAVPVRVHLVPTEQSVEQALSQTQDQLARMLAYEQTGLGRIRMAGSDASAACDFQNFLVIQPEQRIQASQSGVFSCPSIQKYENLLSFSLYPFTLCCMVKSRLIEFQACVEPSVMTADNARALLHQMGHVYGELVENSEARLGDIGVRTTSVD